MEKGVYPMSEKDQDQQAQSPAPSADRPSRTPSKGQQRKSQHSVFQYVTILFAAAFVLLLFTFMMERRQYEQDQTENQEQINQLQQDTNSATQRLDAIIAERDQLKEENQALNEQLESADQACQALEAGSVRQQRALEAMDWFWRIQRLYSRGNLRSARELAEAFEESGLTDALPDISYADPEGNSPKAQYQELYELLF